MRKVLYNQIFERRPQSAPIKERANQSKIIRQQSPYCQKIRPIQLNLSFQSRNEVSSVKHRKKQNRMIIIVGKYRKQLNKSSYCKNDFPFTFNDSKRCITPLQNCNTLSIGRSQRSNITSQIPSTTKNNQFTQIALELEIELTENLKKINLTESKDIISQQKMEIYRNVFKKVIDRDKNFGALLCQIFQAYEQSAKQQDNQSSSQNSQMLYSLQKELKEVKKQLCIEKEEKQHAEKKIQFLARENLQISKQLEEREAQLEELSKTLQNLDQKQIYSQYANNENNWNDLIEQNQSLQDLCKQMQRQLKANKKKEQQVSKLLKYIKDKGIPIEALYEEMQKSQRSKKDSIKSASNQISQESSAKNNCEPETPQISAKIQGKQVERPQCVPPLDLAKINI